MVKSNADNQSTWFEGLPPTWLRFLVIITLTLAIFFRFVNLEKKVYWKDEVYTSLQASGYQPKELVEQFYNNGGITQVKDLQKYQQINSEKSWIDTIKSLAVDDSQHPPLHLLMTRWWMQLFGSSIAVTRSLSAVLSLLVFPSIYWLCIELFEFSLVGWVAILLIAVSPLHVLYAQEARPYSLWTIAILLSGAALLRAMRLKTKLSWGIYAATMTLGFYTTPLTLFYAIAHGIYVIVTQGWRLTKTLIDYLLASIAAILGFAPWIVVIILSLLSGQKTADSWLKYRTFGIPELILRWGFNLSRLVIDFNTGFSYGSPIQILDLISTLACVTLVGYSIYFLVRHAPRKSWLFVLILIIIPALFLILPDILLGGRRSIILRFLIPSYLAIQIALAYMLANKINHFSVKIWQQKLWQLCLVALLSIGILSCITSAEAETWWHKAGHQTRFYSPAAQIINQSIQPLLISDSNWADVVSFSYKLDPRVGLQLVEKPAQVTLKKEYKELFIYNPSPQLIQILQTKQNYKLEPADKSKDILLWRLKKK